MNNNLYRVAAGTALSAALITGAGSIASATTVAASPIISCYVSIDGASSVKILASRTDCVVLQHAHTTATAAHRAAERRAIIRGRHQAERREAREAAAAAAKAPAATNRAMS